MSDDRVNRLEGELHSIKTAQAITAERLDQLARVTTSIMESQRDIVEILGNQKKQDAINDGLNYKINHIESRVNIIYNKQNSQNESIIASREKLIELGYKITVIALVLYMAFPSLRGALPF